MKRKVIIAVAVVAVIAIFVSIAIIKNGSTSTFGGGADFTVKVEKVTQGNISSSVSASGVVEEIEKAEVYFDTPTKVKKILVKQNDKVTKGQKLIEVDMDDLNNQLEELKISQAMTAADKTTASMQAQATQAQNSLKSAQRALAESKKNLDKSKSLYAANAISKNDFENAQKAVDDAQAGFETAQSAYDAAVKNLNANSDTQVQNVKLADLRITELENKIKKMNESMLSPIDGVITQVNVTEGGFTSNMQPAFKLVNPDKLQVRANVNQYNAKSVAAGQNVAITGDAINKDDKVTGKVASIAAAATKAQTSMNTETVIEALISIDNVVPTLKPGVSVTCDIATKEVKDALVIDMGVLKQDKDGNQSVFVVDDKNIMHEKSVKLGATSDLKAEIVEGLKVGDKVVMTPQPSYKDGAKVNISKDTIK